MAEIEKKWYVLRAISGKEANILKLILRTVTLVNMYLRY